MLCALCASHATAQQHHLFIYLTPLQHKTQFTFLSRLPSTCILIANNIRIFNIDNVQSSRRPTSTWRPCPPHPPYSSYSRYPTRSPGSAYPQHLDLMGEKQASAHEVAARVSWDDHVQEARTRAVDRVEQLLAVIEEKDAMIREKDAILEVIQDKEYDTISQCRTAKFKAVMAILSINIDEPDNDYWTYDIDFIDKFEWGPLSEQNYYDDCMLFIAKHILPGGLASNSMTKFCPTVEYHKWHIRGKLGDLKQEVGHETIIFELKKGDADSPHVSIQRNKSVPPPLVILTDLRRVACLLSFDAEKQTVRVEPITKLEELQKRISKALSDGSSSDNAGGVVKHLLFTEGFDLAAVIEQAASLPPEEQFDYIFTVTEPHMHV